MKNDPRNKTIILFVSLFFIASILILFAIIFRDRRNITIIEPSSPKLMGINENIVLLNDGYNQSDIEKFTIKITPETNFDKHIENNKLTIIPKYYNPNTNYSLQIFLNGGMIFNFGFKTKSENELTTEEKKLIGDSNSINEEWIDKLPIEDSNYIITYDYLNKFIRIRILSSYKFDQKEITSITNEATIKLRAIGVPESVKIDIVLD